MGFEPTILGSEPGSTNHTRIDWHKFDEYLYNSFGPNTVKDYKLYARQFSAVLTSGDASPLLSLSDCKRRHTMAALAALSNFMGAKEQWKGIVSKHNLKWAGRNDLGDIVGLLYSNRFTEMVSELKKGLEGVPEEYASYFRFDVLTGLRPGETVQSVNLLKTSPNYLNTELQVLEHFSFPKVFIRNTKKAFISVVDKETIEIGRLARPIEYAGLRSWFRKRGLPFPPMRYCRKVFATYMRKIVDAELVDLLQGRVPTSVFAKHYNRPNNREELERVRAALPELRKVLE